MIAQISAQFVTDNFHQLEVDSARLFNYSPKMQKLLISSEQIMLPAQKKHVRSLSSVLINIKARDLQLKLQDESRALWLKQLAARKSEYGKQVKQLFLPKRSLSLQQQLKRMQVKLKHPVREQTKLKPSAPIPLFKKPPKSQPQTRHESAVSKPRYLEFSKSRAQEVTIGDWRPPLMSKRLTSEQQLRSATYKTHQLESKALRQIDCSDSDQGTSLLIDAIRAKLAVLSRL